ncbi:MAG TPA: peptidylprolyl isomerase [Bacteroidales bacterium]
MPQLCNLSKNKLRTGFIRTLILFLWFAFGCITNKSNETVLQIGSYNLTVADFEKIRSDNKKRNRTIGEKQLEKKLIEEGYILAYDLDNRFDTITLLKNRLKYASRLYASKVDGFVWNQKVKPFLNVSKNDLLDAYHKRDSAYELELICFPQQGLVEKFLNTGDKVKSAADFYLLKDRVTSSHEIKFFKYRQRYPFIPLGIYIKELSNGKAGDVWGPVETLNGYDVVHVAGIKKISQPVFEQEKSTIEKELLKGLTEKYIWESQKDILSKANPAMQDNAIREMASKCIVDKREWPGIDRKMVLMNYDFQGKRLPYTVADFIEFVNCEPVFSGSLTDANDVKGMLKTYLFDIYLFAEAQKMNIENDSEYKLFRKQYLNGLYVQYYKEKNIPRSVPDDEEVKKYYNQNRNNLKSFESATVSIFKFGDKSSSFNGLAQIAAYYNQRTNGPKYKLQGLNGLRSFENVKINLTDTSYKDIFINNLSKAREGQVLPPLEVNGEFWVVYLIQKSGTNIIPYKYAKAEIESKLYEKNRQNIYDSLQVQLNSKYPVRINHLENYLKANNK